MYVLIKGHRCLCTCSLNVSSLFTGHETGRSYDRVNGLPKSYQSIHETIGPWDRLPTRLTCQSRLHFHGIWSLDLNPTCNPYSNCSMITGLNFQSVVKATVCPACLKLWIRVVLVQCELFSLLVDCCLKQGFASLKSCVNRANVF